MVRADKAEVFWEEQKKGWVVRIQVGEEVIRRTCKDGKRDLADDNLRELAVKTAQEEGYQLAPDSVAVKR